MPLASLTAIDTHCHAWDAACAYIGGTAYLPAEPMPLSRLLAQWDAHDVQAGVLVQPSFLGIDNRYLLDALEAHPRRLRGVVVPDPAADLAHIEAWHRLGVRGFRFNMISARGLPDLRAPAWRDWISAAARLGWHIVAAGSAMQLSAALPRLADTGLSLVLDHWALPDRRTGIEDPAWQACLAHARDFPVWIKLSAPYRLGGLDAAALLPLIVQAVGGHRLLWGSDWPCTRHEDQRNFAALRRLPASPLPNGQPLMRQCAANAAELYA